MILSEFVQIPGIRLWNSNEKRLAAITVHWSSRWTGKPSTTIARSLEMNSNATATNTAIVAMMELTP